MKQKRDGPIEKRIFDPPSHNKIYKNYKNIFKNYLLIISLEMYNLEEN